MGVKKGKGHSKKARHHTGIPAGGSGVKVAKRGKSVTTGEPMCLCGRPLQFVKLVGGTGKQKQVLWCNTCGVMW